jgi:thioredoxin 1
MAHPYISSEFNGQGRAAGAVMASRRARGNMSSTTKVTDASFETDVLKASGPVLVDFWAEWCGPCKMIAPALEDLAGEMGDKFTIAKLNIDENPKTPGQYGVRGIPTLMLFKDGKVAATKIGALPKGQLYQWVESVL